MSATLVEKWAIPIGQSKALCGGTITLDSSYATGGEVIDAAGDGYESMMLGGDDGYVLKFIRSTQAVQAWRIGALDGNAASAQALTEVASTTDLSAVVSDYWAIRAA